MNSKNPRAAMGAAMIAVAALLGAGTSWYLGQSSETSSSPSGGGGSGSTESFCLELDQADRDGETIDGDDPEAVAKGQERLAEVAKHAPSELQPTFDKMKRGLDASDEEAFGLLVEAATELETWQRKHCSTSASDANGGDAATSDTGADDPSVCADFIAWADGAGMLNVSEPAKLIDLSQSLQAIADRAEGRTHDRLDALATVLDETAQPLIALDGNGNGRVEVGLFDSPLREDTLDTAKDRASDVLFDTCNSESGLSLGFSQGGSPLRNRDDDGSAASWLDQEAACAKLDITVGVPGGGMVDIRTMPSVTTALERFEAVINEIPPDAAWLELRRLMLSLHTVWSDMDEGKAPDDVAASHSEEVEEAAQAFEQGLLEDCQLATEIVVVTA